MNIEVKVKTKLIFAGLFFSLFNTACAHLPVNFGSPKETPVAEIVKEENTPTTSEDNIYIHQCLNQYDKVDPESFENLWERISFQFEMAIPSNRRLTSQKNWYAKHPEYLRRVSKRASPYLYFIVSEIEKRNLPLELALLPIVESAFDPFAYSHGRAAGMWQFVPATGKSYGLEQNWWFDGRRDVYLSTQASLDYLTYLHKRFKGDWLHALAAYNSGEGNVRKAIRKNTKKGKPTDFWSLKLPKETKAYVPKLLALADLLKSSNFSANEAHLSNWTFSANEPYFMRVSTESQIDLSLIADLSEQTMARFYQLNPAFNHWATPPKGPHYVLLPIDKVEVFNRNFKTIPKKERIAFKRYTIKPGDSLIKIAEKNSTSVNLLQTTNNIKGNRIRAGKSLLIPIASKSRQRYSKSNQQRLLASHQTQRKGIKTSIKVKSGDSFWTLSRRYKVNMRSLAKWNNMAPRDTLKVGQTLVMWTQDKNNFALNNASLIDSNRKTKKIHYKVKNGDSFARIASKFKTSINNLKKWNKLLSRKKYLQPGQSVTLFVDITKQF